MYKLKNFRATTQDKCYKEIRVKINIFSVTPVRYKKRKVKL